jgi:hypothetical protein
VKDIKDLLVKFYSSKQSSRQQIDCSFLQNTANLSVYTLNPGLGDAIVLTSLSKNQKNYCLYSPNKHWETLIKFNQNLNKDPVGDRFIRTELLEFFDLGNGHLHQRLQRAFGLEQDLIPKGYLYPTKQIQKNKRKIAICFSTGNSGLDLISVGFKNPRRLDESAEIEIKKFIESSDYEFVELGSKRMFEYENVKDFTGKTVEDSLNELSSCEYFIGLNSGFMNAAAALSIKSIILLNVPKIEDLYLPVIKDFYDETSRSGQDIQWLFPQNVFLHQHGENKLVPIVSCDNIKKALNGEVYPFWKTDYLDLIF